MNAARIDPFPAAEYGAPDVQRYLTLQQVADAWQVDVNTVRRIFIDEPGVLRLATPRRGRRLYVTLRIPQHVLERVQLGRIVSGSKRG